VKDLIVATDGGRCDASAPREGDRVATPNGSPRGMGALVVIPLSAHRAAALYFGLGHPVALPRLGAAGARSLIVAIVAILTGATLITLAAPSRVDAERGASAAKPSAEERAGLALVDSIEAANRGLTDLSARFRETAFQPVFEDSVVSHGEVFFQKPGRLLLRYAAPDSSLLVVNEKIVWLYQPALGQAHRFVLNERSTVYGLLLGFGGSFGEAKKHFRFVAEPKEAKGGERTLRAVPRPGSPAAEDLAEIVLTIDPARRWIPVRTRFREAGGDERVFVFGEFERNEPLAPSLFEFTPPQGTEIFEMQK
jgi:outer membrane lipoprotein carrier protein